MITITPLGVGGVAASTSSSGEAAGPALCHLIRLDQSYLLLDCGAPEDLMFPTASGTSLGSPSLASYTDIDGDIDTEKLAKLPLDDAIQLIAPRISLVLLSHSTLGHIGLYAYAKARLGLTCPAYATLPTAAMGRLVTLEAALTIGAECDVSRVDKRPRRSGSNRSAGAGTSRNLVMAQDDHDSTARDRCIPTINEINEAFENLRTLRYLQPTVLDGPLSSLSLSAHSAGHTLGGAVWKLRSPTSGTIILAIDWNHVKERHIDGSSVIESLSSQGSEATNSKRADLFVTSGEAVGKVNLRRKDKDKRLLDLIHHTLTVSRSVLHLPLDASPRLLEIILLLDQHWAYSYPHVRFPLCLVSRTGKEVLERSRTMREWMGKNLQAEETARDGRSGTRGAGQETRDGAHGPLDFRFLRIFTSMRALDEAFPRDSPKVVITVGPSLLYGPSLHFFYSQVAPDSKNVIVLTQRDKSGSVARQLRTWWEDMQDKDALASSIGGEVSAGGRILPSVPIRGRVILQGKELEDYLEQERVKKEKDDQQKAIIARSRQRLEADQDDDDDDDDDEEDDEEDEDLDGNDSDDEIGDAEELKSKSNPYGRKGKGPRKAAGLPSEGPDALFGGEGDMTILGSSVSHDIFLQGASANATTFFSSARGSGTSQSDREAMARHGVGIRYRTAPVIEKRKRIDAFGEVVDVAHWLSRGRKEQELEERKANTSGLPTSENADKRLRKDGERSSANDGGPPVNKEEDEFDGVPTKFTQETANIAVHCKIVSIDLEGLIDGRALSIVLPQLAPRRLVLVNTPQPLNTPLHGQTQSPDSATTPTSTFISSLLGIRDFTRDIYAPGLGHRISVGAEIRSFDVKLGEGVLEQLRMSGWEDWGLGWLRGRVAGELDTSLIDTVEGDDVGSTAIKAEDRPTAITLETIEDTVGASMDLRPSDPQIASGLKGVYTPKSRLHTTIAPLKHAPTAHPTLFVGDVRLSKLKNILTTTHRIPSEFGGGGMLICGAAALSQATGHPGISSDGPGMTGLSSANQAAAAVMIQKVGERFVMEGNAGRTFVKVRDVMYDMHARVGDL